MTKQQFVDKWGYQSRVGQGSAQFDCRKELLKDLDKLMINQTECTHKFISRTDLCLHDEYWESCENCGLIIAIAK